MTGLVKRPIVFKIDDAVVEIEIRNKINTGVYRLDGLSGTGKSRLCKLLDDYRIAGYPVV